MAASIEDRLTIACFNWVRYKYPTVLSYHTPNGGKRSKAAAGRFKAMGVLAGVPDVTIAYPCGSYAGLYIELKPELITYKKGKQQVDRQYPRGSQREFLAKAWDVGYAVDVCWNIDQFMKAVNSYMAGNFQMSDYMQGMLERELETEEA